MDEKAKHAEYARKHMGGRVLKNICLATRKSLKNAQTLQKTKSPKNTPRMPFSGPGSVFFRIPRAFLILLAGFSSNFAKSGPSSGNFSVSECPCANFHVAKVSLFRPPTPSSLFQQHLYPCWAQRAESAIIRPSTTICLSQDVRAK